MTEITIKMLATEIHASIDYLVQQFSHVGITKQSADDLVTIQEKQVLLAYMNNEYNSNPSKLTLQRKTRSTLNISSASGKSKSVQIEVRKKRIFVKQEYLNKNEQINFLINTNKNEKKLENANKDIETTQYKILEEKDKINTELTNEKIETNISEKNNLKNKSIELQIKKETKVHCKLEEMASSATKNFSHTTKENEGNWSKKTISCIEDFNDYHAKNFQYSSQADDDNDCRVDNSRNRSARTTRYKKSNKHSEFKANREEDRAITRSGKFSNKRKKNSSLQQGFQKPIKTVNRDVIIGETITIGELANKMAVKSSQVIKVMIKMGAMATINQIIDQETAQIVAEEMGHKVILRNESNLEDSIMNDRYTSSIVEPRAPIVTVMGHVDHGKTSLLDCIRSTRIAYEEAGNITQNIGAYHVKTKDGGITFLDTPGHAAFTAMRARGVQITDIVVLVVAADDGVMPQTIEAIQHAKIAKVPIIVAISKIDKPEADFNRIKTELTQHGIVSEEWGGDCQFVYVSAREGIGIDTLLNAILLQAEILELKAIHEGMASGVVIESFLDKGKGPVATILVLEGTLNKGNIVLCGFEYGRIRAMRNELGQEITEAGPSMPVEIFGLSGIPVAGDKMTVIRNEKKAREVALYRQGKFREVKLARQQKSKLENIMSNMITDNHHELNIIVKADVHGAIEAISNALLQLSTNKVKVKILSAGVGGITETDAALAATSNAILVGFNVRADAPARRLIEMEHLDLRYYSVIYHLIDQIKTIMDDMLSPELKQHSIGFAEVRNVFKSPKSGTIAGCIVTEGTVKRCGLVRCFRNNEVTYEGEIESLRRFKEDVNEVRNGMECGITFKNYHDIRTGDIIEIFEFIKTRISTVN